MNNKPKKDTNSGGFFGMFSYAEETKSVEPRMQPICESHKRLLRINRKLHEQQILVIVEEEEEELPDLRIENKCSNLSIVFQQSGNKKYEEIDVCLPKQQ